MNVAEEIKGKKILHWFRKDLRSIDHEIISNRNLARKLTCFYLFDEKHDNTHPLGFPIQGETRKQFLNETLNSLQVALEEYDIEIIFFENIEALKKHVFESFDILTYQRQYGTEEEQQEQEVKRIIGCKTLTFNSFTLLSENDLPFTLHNLPFTFTPFRKKVEKYGTYQAPLETVDISNYTLAPDSFTGGFKAALSRLNYYTYQSKLLSTYKETRNGLLGSDFSSRLSPWLANGSISPRFIYNEVKAYEETFGSNESTYWLVFELLWRDFFQFQLMHFGSRFFYKTGIKEATIACRQNSTIFWEWANGETQDDFVNANMKELNATGWMSNRGRQNVASYLIHDLNIDWRWGAAYFESQLLDYDVASNWGNWMYIAGVGNDPRPSRKFNTQKQAERYDPNREFTSYWNTNNKLDL